MYRYHPIDQHTAVAYAPLLPAEARPLLDHLAPSEERTEESEGSAVVAVGAAFLGKPRGLALALYHHEQHTARLLDLVVAKPYRGAGVGSHLLHALHVALAARGCTKVYALYRTDAHTPALERVLARNGWDAPRTDRLLFWGGRELVNARWMQRARLPAGYTVFPWVELTDHERAALEQRHAQQEGGWWREGLSPFSFAMEELDAVTSLGLRRGNEIVGWMLNRLLEAGIIGYDVLFVSPELQRSGYGIRLLAASIWQHYHHHGVEGGWGVAPDNAPMLRFVERGMGPWLIERGEERYAEKALAEP
jgi:GNAT superfamily N-acetyltransferase